MLGQTPTGSVRIFPASRLLQWRAEQLLGQTRGRRRTWPMLGRFNGGPSNCSAKHPRGHSAPRRIAALQWRAEQLLGQTVLCGGDARLGELASMEGRAIARPNLADTLGINRSNLCFNGGPSNCSAKPGPTSFEGPPTEGFNGGPSNCSAKPGSELGVRRVLRASMEGRAIARPNGTPARWGPCGPIWLQWRAEQLLGQTAPSGLDPEGSPGFNGGPSNCSAKPLLGDDVGGGPGGASMEGRAIARPNSRRGNPRTGRLHPLQWRAEQLLGQTSAGSGTVVLCATLQWRAEQLLGQTAGELRGSRREQRGFNGGPSNCSAKPCQGGSRRPAADQASMEGRAIARPNPRWPVPENSNVFWLQWRAEQLLGQTRPQYPRAPPHGRFNGGPSNCSAKPSPPERAWTSTPKCWLQWRAEQLLGQTCLRRPGS